jgi:hypothetical protein
VVRAGINIEPSIRPTRYAGANPNGWWCKAPNCYGVQSGTEYVDAEMPLVARLGVHSLRIEFPWALMEPIAHGSHDWSRSDYIVNSANRHNVNLQPIIVFAPSWESPGFTIPPKASDFSSFVNALVTRYRASIHYWEMWNEPDLSSYFNGTEVQYVSQVLVPGFQAVRGADPGAKVILGGPSYANTDWLNAIYSLGGGQAFDIMAFHDYGPASQVLSDAVLVAGILQKHGQSKKPVWLGEYGVQENTVQDAGQQALLTAVVTGSSPLALAQWYTLRDDFSMTAPGTIYKSAYWGLLQSDDVTLKQGYATLQQLIRQGY